MAEETIVNVEMVDIKTTGTKEAYELGVALKKVVEKVMECKNDDGKITSEEYAEIAVASFTELSSAISGIEKLPNEAKQKPIALGRAVTIPVSEAVEAILAK